MPLTRQYGWKKWNNISTLNYIWELFTWTNNNGSGGSGIKNVIEGGQLGTCSKNPFVTGLIKNLSFWVISLSSGKRVYYETTFQRLKN